MAEESLMVRTLTFGDRRISYDEADLTILETDSEKNFTSFGGGGGGGQFSDLDSGVCEDVCCDDIASSGSPETERKIIMPDVSAIRELTNFDEVTTLQISTTGFWDIISGYLGGLSFYPPNYIIYLHNTIQEEEEEDDRESDEESEDSEDSEDDEKEERKEKGKAMTPVRFSPLISDICLTGFEYHDLGPASLSVLQLDRSELVHMRHVMVKIELDSREVEDSVVSRVEAGRVCVVCTTVRFSLFTGSGLECSVCRYVVCPQCTAANTRLTSTSLLSSPPSFIIRKCLLKNNQLEWLAPIFKQL